MWPWRRKAETRADLGHVIGDRAIEIAAERSTEIGRLAAAETVAGFVGRCFAAASVTGTDRLTPDTMMLAGREAVLRGEIVFLVPADDLLVPVQSFDVLGTSPDPGSWFYRCHYAVPRGTQTMIAPADAVLHLRIGTSPGAPWRGLSPLRRAGLSVDLLAALSESLRSASNPMAVSQVLEVGVDKDGNPHLSVEQYEQVKTIIEAEGKIDRGRLRLLPPGLSIAAPDRHGAEQGEVALLRAGAESVYAAAGLPASLFIEGGDGAAQREAYRRAVRSTIEPMAKILAAEATKKLGEPVTIDLAPLRGSDSAMQARAFAALTKAGLDRDEALYLSGLDTP